MTHHLNCTHECFEKMLLGVQNFDFRRNDRDFKVGDELVQHELDEVSLINDPVQFTGRTFTAKVMYVLYGPAYGVPERHCIMALYGGFLTFPEKKA